MKVKLSMAWPGLAIKWSLVSRRQFLGTPWKNCVGYRDLPTDHCQWPLALSLSFGVSFSMEKERMAKWQLNPTSPFHFLKRDTERERRKGENQDAHWSQPDLDSTRRLIHLITPSRIKNYLDVTKSLIPGTLVTVWLLFS